MKKKQIKHFVPKKNQQTPPGTGNGILGGIPACNCFVSIRSGRSLPAWMGFGEVAKTRKNVTCKNCRRTKVFRKIKNDSKTTKKKT